MNRFGSDSLKVIIGRRKSRWTDGLLLRFSLSLYTSLHVCVCVCCVCCEYVCVCLCVCVYSRIIKARDRWSRGTSQDVGHAEKWVRCEAKAHHTSSSLFLSLSRVFKLSQFYAREILYRYGYISFCCIIYCDFMCRNILISWNAVCVYIVTRKLRGVRTSILGEFTEKNASSCIIWVSISSAHYPFIRGKKYFVWLYV